MVRSFAEGIQRAFRRVSLTVRPRSVLRRARLRLLGARIGSGTSIPRINIPWPHQVAIGDNCILQDDVFFNFDHYWVPGPSIIVGDRVFIGRGCEFNIRSRLTIGDECLIASGVKIIDHDHGTKTGCSMRSQEGAIIPVSIGEDVWIGTNAVVLKGVCIGHGAVLAAGSVATKSIPAMEIWAGVPAKKIGERA